MTKKKQRGRKKNPVTFEGGEIWFLLLPLAERGRRWGVFLSSLGRKGVS